MVGGIVIGIVRGEENTLLRVKDAKSENSSGDECFVRCIERRIKDDSPIQIAQGDLVWWQCGKIMWTPKENAGKPICDHEDHYNCNQRCDVDYDIRLPKVGYSY